MFNHKNINCVESVKDWKEAIKLSSEVLLKNGDIKSEYIDKMINNIMELGFYVVIDEFVAMPHARPEDGAINTAISFLKVNEGVDFGGEKIYLIFTLAAKDAKEHIGILQKLMDILQNEKLKDELINCKDKEKLISLLN